MKKKTSYTSVSLIHQFLIQIKIKCGCVPRNKAKKHKGPISKGYMASMPHCRITIATMYRLIYYLYRKHTSESPIKHCEGSTNKM